MILEGINYEDVDNDTVEFIGYALVVDHAVQDVLRCSLPDAIKTAEREYGDACIHEMNEWGGEERLGELMFETFGDDDA